MAKKRSNLPSRIWQELSVSNATPLEISQDMMQRAWDLSEIETAAHDELIQLRTNFGTLLRAGATVAPGPFDFKMGQWGAPIIVNGNGLPGGFQQLAAPKAREE
jgi:hypothetical protein